MSLTVISCPLPGLFLLEPKVFGDERGFFYESFSQRDVDGLGVAVPWVQDNHSKSAKGVLRGLHFQVGRMAQDKLVRCTAGRVWDVVVDIRRSSPTFGQWAGFELSSVNKRMVLIPKGFAHGFLSLEDGSEFLYKCSSFYDPISECGVAWDDPEVGIEWPLEGAVPQLSLRDRAWSPLRAVLREMLFP